MFIMHATLYHVLPNSNNNNDEDTTASAVSRMATARPELRPVRLLRVFLLRVLESNFPGNSL